MTAYVVLKHHPLRVDDSSRRFVVGQDDVVDTETRRRDGQSVVDEQLTERDALMAILLPSANNVAVLVARQVSGSVPSFVAEMNRTARAFGDVSHHLHRSKRIRRRHGLDSPQSAAFGACGGQGRDAGGHDGHPQLLAAGRR
jgi:D-alanyl-D-alanine carboxypeptidase